MSAVQTAELDERLSTLMRDGSRAAHESAENSNFISELLAGRVNETGYATYLGCLRRVYRALESVGPELAGHPFVDAVHDPVLDRTPALEADLAHWGTAADLSPATSTYVDRIEASRTWPGLYIAHHYTRYLGDLSGGQAIGRFLDRTFDLGGAGVAFYDFPAIPKPKPYKDAYRARLDALPLSAADKTRVVEEVTFAFGLNQALFDELGANLDAYRR